jgi:hypothetical protein
MSKYSTIIVVATLATFAFAIGFVAPTLLYPAGDIEDGVQMVSMQWQ